MTTLIPNELGIMESSKINTFGLKEIILCADDYAQNLPISEGILKLANANKINAISCMTNSPLWDELAKNCLQVYSHSYVGLHLNLTEGLALSQAWKNYYGPNFTNLMTLLKRCYVGGLNFEVVKSEIEAQIDAFCKISNVLPDFIDGHQHIHQLPVIRDILLKMYQQQKITKFFRSTYYSFRSLLATDNFPKSQLIALLGGYTFKKRLIAEAIPTNTSFGGVYNFSQAKNYPKYFKEFLRKSSHKGIIMCHPGNFSKDLKDPLKSSRAYELNYFLSDEFVEDLKKNKVHLMDKNTSNG